VSSYRLDLEYEGTAFSGWAKQPGRRTVQAELERVLSILLREPVGVRVAGRTDAGVHATAQVASFDAADGLDLSRLRLSLNSLLPPDVAVSRVGEAAPGFDARAAQARTYRYRLWLSPTRPALQRGFVWHVHRPVDTAILAAAAELFVGRRDWSGLTPSARLYRSCVREVTEAAWARTAEADGCEPESHEWVFTVTAGSFLHMMVRVMVGSMVDAARGHMTLEDLRRGIESGERVRMGRTAPARGLCLVDVRY
jgi:tRNA pseudouridine38-40 synthase